jgi:hypothetical protein
MSKLADSLAVLRETEYRKLFFGQAASVVGVMFTLVALPFAVLEIGGTATDIGLVEAANLVPLAVFVLVGGVLVSVFQLSWRDVRSPKDMGPRTPAAEEPSVATAAP